MNISTRQMQAFAMVAQCASFTRAAERLHITQSGLSAMTRALEAQFGTRLFERTTRTVSLTRAGKELLPSIERALAELASAQTRVSRASDDAASVLTLAATPMVASSLLPNVLAAFDQEANGVTVRVRDAVGTGIQQLVAEGEADVGLGVFRAPVAGVLIRPLMKFHLIAVFKPGALVLRSARSGGLEQLVWSRLRDVPVLTLTVPDITQQLVASHLAAAGHAHPDSRAYDSLHTMVAMASAGYGVAIVPSFALSASLRYGAQCARMVAPSATINWFSVVRKGATENPAWLDFQRTLTKVAYTDCMER